MADQERRERIAQNEASTRGLNESLEQQRDSPHREDDDVAGFLCECYVANCSAVVHVPIAKYKAVRQDDRSFLIRPGHDEPEVEDVVELGDHYAIVRKHTDVSHVVQR